jgi:hypothetical protein
MISAQNRLQLLSGNKLAVIALLTALMLNTASCHTSKPVSNSNTNPAPKAETPKTEKKEERAEKKEPKRRPTDSLEKVFPVTLKDKYNVAVFLPLYLNAPDRETTQKTSVTVSQDFYKGLLVAADTLKHCGLKMDVHVYDYEDPKFTYSAITDSMKRIDADIMIGPLLESKNTYFVDSISVRNKINHISPLQVDEHNRNANYYLESLPSAYEQGLAAARMVKEHYKPYKVLLINEKSTKDNPTAQAFASCFRQDSITVIDFGGKGATTYTPEIDYGDSAIIFIPSKNEVFVSGLMAQLRTAPQPKIVIGLMQWQFFKTFEADLWEKMDLHIVSPYFVDYRQWEPIITKMANIETLGFVRERLEGAKSFTVKTDEFYIPFKEAAEDVAAERERIEKELEYTRGFLQSVLAKLSNERFVQNARPDIIEKEVQKKEDAETKIRLLEEDLARLN